MLAGLTDFVVVSFNNYTIKVIFITHSAGVPEIKVFKTFLLTLPLKIFGIILDDKLDLLIIKLKFFTNV